MVTKEGARPVFTWSDPLALESQLSEDERMVRDSVHSYCRERLLPRVREGFRHERFERSIVREMGELGMLGPTIEGYGCPGLSHV
ncbi:MAG TPA: acyl-CoA dehydrogenase family protein, partial [Gammaproteobacteria bacterium]|nr:acyl-CoA dehydrogenase family protein [Gammaproteobacteria bacterium]